MGVPIPRIYDWSAETSNPVGAEYILEEKATGKPLGNMWANLTLPSQLDIMNQIVDVEKKMAAISFQRHGCIYYETDLKSRSLDYEAFDSQDSSSLESATGQKTQPPAFVIGPSASPSFWERGKADMDVERGPCTLPR